MKPVQDEHFQIEMPTDQVAKNTDLVNYLNDHSIQMENKNPGFTIWHFENFGKAISTTVNIQESSRHGDLSYRLYCENLDALFISYGSAFDHLGHPDK
ncbi:MAG: hypothetical protein AAF600_06760 [Bacteroidota bacterium]